MAEAKLISVRMEVVVDEDPDLSFLGEYSNTPKAAHSIDRRERGDLRRGEFRYFTPAMTGEQTGNPESEEQDYRRMEAYSRGDWRMTGIRAVAEVQLKSGTHQTIRSAGLWGVESDCGDDYRKEVFQNELATLMADLEDLGITTDEVVRAAQEVE